MQKMETFIACKLVLAQKKHSFDEDCLCKPFYGKVDGGCLDSIIEGVIIFFNLNINNGTLIELYVKKQERIARHVLKLFMQYHLGP